MYYYVLCIIMYLSNLIVKVQSKKNNKIKKVSFVTKLKLVQMILQQNSTDMAWVQATSIIKAVNYLSTSKYNSKYIKKKLIPI